VLQFARLSQEAKVRGVLPKHFLCLVVQLTKLFNNLISMPHLNPALNQAQNQSSNHRENQYIYQLVWRNPKPAYKALVLELDTRISCQTIQRVLQSYQLRKWKSLKQIRLTKDGAKAQLAFAKYWLDLRFPIQLKNLLAGLFSSECSVQNNTNNPVAWVFQYASEKWLPDLVNLKGHLKANISIMVWAMVFKGGRSLIVIIEQDSNAPRNRYTAESYKIALEKGLLEFYKPGQLFQQDNAKIHVAATSKEWFEKHGI
jgi:hypothetical protein